MVQIAIIVKFEGKRAVKLCNHIFLENKLDFC